MMKYCIVCVLIFLSTPLDGCGPGRRPGTRGRRHKTTPLVYQQHIPNVSELTLGASGPTEGKIERDDPEFKDLVVNYNPDIIFKDEEGTGADRIMTQRCKDKLNTLAISVMNKWEGVKLRVSEAWDEDRTHAPDSLHYEGRAVDITTSDRDRQKYGMLARLAVEAGFDWVYFESRSHVHASVKSDSSIAIATGGCFPAASTAYRSDGSTISMSDLEVGEDVLTFDPDTGYIQSSEVILFLHRTPTRSLSYVVLETSSGRNISLTPSHLIYTSTASTNATADIQSAEAIYASNVKEGQHIFMTHNTDSTKTVCSNSSCPTEYDAVRAERVLKVHTRMQKGAYAPVTRLGNIIVNDAAASCYAVVNSHMIAHVSFAPIRVYYSVKDIVMTMLSPIVTKLNRIFVSQTCDRDFATVDDDVHPYARFLHTIAPYFIDISKLYGH